MTMIGNNTYIFNELSSYLFINFIKNMKNYYISQNIHLNVINSFEGFKALVCLGYFYKLRKFQVKVLEIDTTSLMKSVKTTKIVCLYSFLSILGFFFQCGNAKIIENK